ncbi:MAG: NADH-quinone oxidoreductase subunit B [Fimbriimonadales bacterium]
MSDLSDMLVKVPGGSILIGPIEEIFKWARKSSMWSLTFGLSCCAIEMISTAASHYDLDRFGILFRATPRQADVMIVAGWVSVKMAPLIRRLYEQMPEPKYVVAMGGCASAGGPYRDSETIVKGVDNIVPVDVYVYGCPPRPENLIHGLLMLQERISKESLRRDPEDPTATPEPIVIQA